MPELAISTAKTRLQGDAQLFSKTFKGEKGEQAIALLHIEGREREAHHFVQECFATIERAILTAEGEAYIRLEECLKELNGLLKGTLISEHIHSVHAVIALTEADGTLHVAQAGRAEAYLTRGGSTTQITESSSFHGSLVQFLHISSGTVREGDGVILSTERLFRSMTPSRITQTLRHRGEALERIREVLEGERETAVLALLAFKEKTKGVLATTPSSLTSRRTSSLLSIRGRNMLGKAGRKHQELFRRAKANLPSMPPLHSLGEFENILRSALKNLQRVCKQFFDDLQHPTRKRKAHLLLLAGAIVVFVGIYAGFKISTTSKRHQSRIELEKLVETINSDLKLAENRQLMGDLESANAVLSRAEQEARSVMQHESGLFRTDALELLDRIRAKREVVNNIVRLTPTVVANLSAQNADIAARGLIGIERGRFIVYDRQNLYSIIVNAVDEPQRLDGENLILDGAPLERFKTQIFLTQENRLIELIEGQPTAMKTDDPGGWLTGPDMETYLRFLYILSPQNNQILKYERLSNRYSPPSEYNVNGNLEGAIDMTIDSDVYVLHQGGTVTKLFRGETKPFAFRNLPEHTLKNVIKFVKPSEQGNFYFLDPEDRRIIVTRADDNNGESLYLKQFILEGDQVGTLQDLYVDTEESQLFVLGEKKLYSISLQQG